MLSDPSVSLKTNLKRKLIDTEHPSLSIRQQCELLGLNRSSYYYQAAKESELNLKLMKLIDQQYLKTPFYGYRKMTVYLRQSGYLINRKRTQHLMNLMGIQAVAPRPRTSIPGKGHKIYPYLLRGLKITHPNQVWSADITYIPMRQGFMYRFGYAHYRSGRCFGLVQPLCPLLGNL
jgi:putative transposase